jgi:hypothetical protein
VAARKKRRSLMAKTLWRRDVPRPYDDADPLTWPADPNPPSLKVLAGRAMVAVLSPVYPDDVVTFEVVRKADDAAGT